LPDFVGKIYKKYFVIVKPFIILASKLYILSPELSELSAELSSQKISQNLKQYPAAVQPDKGEETVMDILPAVAFY